MRSSEPPPPSRGPVAVATSPARLAGELLLALPYVVRELPPLVQDLRQLVHELTRMAGQGGELNDLIGETARLAGAKADEVRAREALAAAVAAHGGAGHG